MKNLAMHFWITVLGLCVLAATLLIFGLFVYLGHEAFGLPGWISGVITVLVLWVSWFIGRLMVD